jgi:Cu+-exporting ATPase
VDTSAGDAAAGEMAARARTPVGVAAAGRLLAVVAVADPLRPDAAAGVARLRSLGLAVVVASGDARAVAEAVGAEVGADEVHAPLRPEDKSALVADLRQRLGQVAMVGDGINDAPALAGADVGIAVGSGTGVAMAAADITLVHGDVGAVADAIALARATRRVIWQNLGWAFGYNLVLVPLAAVGVMPPIFAALAMAFSSVSVVTNALRLRRFGRVATGTGAGAGMVPVADRRVAA